MTSNPHIRTRVAKGGVLVLGGGFAGGSVARRLGKSGATIINPSNFMLYTPLLPEAAAGSIEPRHVAVPLRTMAPHAELMLGRAVAVDTRNRVVRVESDAGTFAVAYAELVVALGSVTRMPAVPGLADHALGVKDISDAIRLRNHVVRQIELADADPDSARRRLTFVVAGGGFAGVETISELHDLAEDALRLHPRLKKIAPRWVLVDGAPRILGQMPEGLSRSAAKVLDRRGIQVLSGTRLRSVDAGGAELSDGRRIEAETVVWTAGVCANPVIRELGLPVDEYGRIPVDETLRAVGAPHVWSLGDGATVPNEATPGQFDPATCQHALRQARRLARNLSGAPRPYGYKMRGQMATLGKRRGVVQVGPVGVRGRLGWLMARGYHLAQMPMAARRRRVATDWVNAALFRRDVAELSLSYRT
jgi:NADH:ubiquinone reductase (H+-translocating)